MVFAADQTEILAGSAPQSNNATATQNSTPVSQVLAINAANGKVDWDLVNSFASSKFSFHVKELRLNKFGETMKNHGFQGALDQSDAVLRQSLTEIKPDILLVASKGVGVATYLATKGLWDGPVVMLSPIPNACDHIEAGSWEEEWASTMNILVSHGLNQIAVGIGSSHDEQILIKGSMEATNVCGRILGTQGHYFEKCPDWFVLVVKGDHGWKQEEQHAIHIAYLIYKVSLVQQRSSRLDSTEQEL